MNRLFFIETRKELPVVDFVAKKRRKRKGASAPICLCEEQILAERACLLFGFKRAEGQDQFDTKALIAERRGEIGLAEEVVERGKIEKSWW